jgi:hypothetical protein
VLISKNNGIVVMNENKTIEEVFSKVPEVTLLFGLLKLPQQLLEKQQVMLYPCL